MTECVGTSNVMDSFDVSLRDKIQVAIPKNAALPVRCGAWSVESSRLDEFVQPSCPTDSGRSRKGD